MGKKGRKGRLKVWVECKVCEQTSQVHEEDLRVYYGDSEAYVVVVCPNCGEQREFEEVEK